MSADILIPLAIQPHPCAAIMANYIIEANTVYEEGQKQYIENVRRLAGLVLKADRNAGWAGVSFRSLFRECGQHADHPQFVFSRAKGMMLLAIAGNPALMSGQHVDHLPSDYTTLSKLAQIPEKKLTKLIEDGTINASMRRTAVAELVNNETRKAAKKATTSVPTATTNTPLPKVAGGVPIASPAPSCAAEIPAEAGKPATDPKWQRTDEAFARMAAARADYLEAIKAVISDFADQYGWHEAYIELVPWLEDQHSGDDDDDDDGDRP